MVVGLGQSREVPLGWGTAFCLTTWEEGEELDPGLEIFCGLWCSTFLQSVTN